MSSNYPILPKDLESFEEKVNGLLGVVKWRPLKKLGLPGSEDASASTKLWRPSSEAAVAAEDSLSLLKIARAIGKDAILLPENVNSTLRTVRTGLCIGMHLGRQYGDAAGLRELEAQNKSGSLSQNGKDDFRNKVITSSAVLLFGTASYVVWKLGGLESDKVSNTHVEFHGVPEVHLQNPIRASECMLYYLAAYLDPEKSGLVKTDLDMVAMTIKYFNALIDEIKTRQGSLKFTNFFTDVSYKLSDSDFTVQGFDALRSTGAVSVEFNKVPFDDIVGNRVAKHEAKRTMQRLFCFDLKAKKNPFVELGGLQSVRMGYGRPGTGKSMQIAATATYGDELSKRTGIPFLFWPWPDNMISTFQGGSAERAIPWFVRLQDDNKIVYAPIDDAENNLEERTRQGVSAGVREVIGVFLRYTEGAYAIKRGNSVIEVFTNIPEQIDKAVLSRVQARFPINGAESDHDFIDQDYLWWKKYHEAAPDFVAMVPPSGYVYLLDQKPGKSLAEFESESVTPSDSRILEVFQGLLKKGIDHTNQDFFGSLFKSVHQIYPGFTSRDVRNIQQAVSARIMDFDIPEEWFDKQEIFFSKDYDAKLEMIKELMRNNMKGLSFADIRLREVVRYLDNMATIANIERERKIEALLEDSSIREEALKRIAATRVG